jgi:DNA gyrase/topoisomerase IV subunit B
MARRQGGVLERAAKGYEGGRSVVLGVMKDSRKAEGVVVVDEDSAGDSASTRRDRPYAGLLPVTVTHPD